MKKLLLCVFSVLFTCCISYAQNSILAGKIIDEYNVPIKGAVIKVSRAGNVTQTSSDEDGLFYTKLLPVGSYHVDVVLGNKYLETKKVYLADGAKKRSYYTLKVVGDVLRITVDGQDPFMRARLGKIENDDKRNIIDFLPRMKRGEPHDIIMHEYFITVDKEADVKGSK
jgi:hypothetical protein